MNKVKRVFKNVLEYIMLPYTVEQILIEHYVSLAQKANQPKGFAATAGRVIK